VRNLWMYALYVSSRKVLRLLVLAIIFWVDLNFPQTALSQEQKQVNAAETPKVKRQPSLGFAGYSRSFKLVCDALAKDGRREVFGLHLEYAIAELEDCSACKSLLRSLAGACKVKPKKEDMPVTPTPDPEADEEEEDEEIEGEPAEAGTPTPTPAANIKKFPSQREPSVALIDAVSQLGIALAADPKRGPVGRSTMEMLASIMRDPEELQPGEAEYLDILAEYLLAPFKHSVENIAVSGDTSIADDEVEVQPSVDDLFE
jgi:hypothetical protein